VSSVLTRRTASLRSRTKERCLLWGASVGGSVNASFGSLASGWVQSDDFSRLPGFCRSLGVSPLLSVHRDSSKRTVSRGSPLRSGATSVCCPTQVPVHFVTGNVWRNSTAPPRLVSRSTSPAGRSRQVRRQQDPRRRAAADLRCSQGPHFAGGRRWQLRMTSRLTFPVVKCTNSVSA
jgi:hypothetical protein